MPAVELELVEAAVVPEDENCNFIFDKIRSNLSKMDQIGLNRISHLSKNVTIKIFTFTTRINGHFFWIIIGSNLSKMAQTGSTRSKMGKTPRS